jgi:Zn-dependent protease
MIPLPGGRATGKPQFRIAGIPVRIEVTFFVFAFLIGYTAERPSIVFYWIPIAFVSILLHEFGHAIAAKSFGDRPTVTVAGLGGLTTFSPRHTRAELLTITLAGPLSALVLLGIPSLLLQQSSWTDPFNDPNGNHYAFATLLVWVNVYWSMVNLLPILPLDGGAVVAHVFGRVRAQQLSVPVALVAGYVAFLHGLPFAALFAGFFALQNITSLSARKAPATPVPEDLLAHLERAYVPGPPAVAGTADAAVAHALVEPLAARLLAHGDVGANSARVFATQLAASGYPAEAGRVAEGVYATGQAPLADAVLAARCWAGADPMRSMSWVDRAIDHGLADGTGIDADPALAATRALPGWPNVRGRLPL